MICPFCGGDLNLRGESVSDNLRRVFYCSSCPMVYLLMKDHEGDQLKAIQVPSKESKIWNVEAPTSVT